MKRFFIFGIMLCLLLTIFCASPCLSFAESEVDLTCKSACLVDYESGTMLFSHNPKEHLPRDRGNVRRTEAGKGEACSVVE